MRAPIQEYQAVEEAAMKFVKSVAEGNSNCLLMRPSYSAIWTEHWNTAPLNSFTTM